jgi:hypothetical protein
LPIVAVRHERLEVCAWRTGEHVDFHVGPSQVGSWPSPIREETPLPGYDLAALGAARAGTRSIAQQWLRSCGAEETISDALRAYAGLPLRMPRKEGV